MTMIGTISRYISWRLLVAIIGILVLCLLLIFMVDMIELLRQSGKYGSVPMWQLLFLSLLRLPSYSELVLPFAVLIGSIGGFLLLSRTSELVIVRSAGMSVWQFILPGVAVAIALGIVAVTLYNPLAASARVYADRLYAETFGKEKSLMRTSNAGSWLRQDGVDGQSVIHALFTSDRGLTLTRVSVFQFDKEGNFFERLEAERAELKDGRWELQDVWVSAVGQEPAHYDRYVVSTYLTQTQVRDSLGSILSVSFWELPKFIEIADKAGLPARRHKLQYQMLLSRPFLLAVMVLLAATCSLRAFRFGGVRSMMIGGLGAGFAFFVLAEISRNLGLAGLASPMIAAWTPILFASFLTLTVLLYQEDG